MMLAMLSLKEPVTVATPCGTSTSIYGDSTAKCGSSAAVYGGGADGFVVGARQFDLHPTVERSRPWTLDPGP
eukprot:3721714-Rhodomonas_salina.1